MISRSGTLPEAEHRLEEVISADYVRLRDPARFRKSTAYPEVRVVLAEDVQVVDRRYRADIYRVRISRAKILEAASDEYREKDIVVKRYRPFSNEIDKVRAIREAATMHAITGFDIEKARKAGANGNQPSIPYTIGWIYGDDILDIFFKDMGLRNGRHLEDFTQDEYPDEWKILEHIAKTQGLFTSDLKKMYKDLSEEYINRIVFELNRKGYIEDLNGWSPTRHFWNIFETRKNGEETKIRYKSDYEEMRGVTLGRGFWSISELHESLNRNRNRLEKILANSETEMRERGLLSGSHVTLQFGRINYTEKMVRNIAALAEYYGGNKDKAAEAVREYVDKIMMPFMRRLDNLTSRNKRPSIISAEARLGNVMIHENPKSGEDDISHLDLFTLEEGNTLRDYARYALSIAVIAGQRIDDINSRMQLERRRMWLDRSRLLERISKGKFFKIFNLVQMYEAFQDLGGIATALNNPNCRLNDYERKRLSRRIDKVVYHLNERTFPEIFDYQRHIADHPKVPTPGNIRKLLEAICRVVPCLELTGT